MNLQCHAGYGSCYVNDEGKLVVLVKEGESAPIRQLSQTTRSSSMTYETCQYSFNELQQVVEEMYVNMVGKSSGRSSGTIYNAGYDIMNESQKTILKDVILARYTSKSGDSGGIVYALKKSTNTRYTVGINLGSITINGAVYGGCIKAYMINQTFGLTRY